MKVLIVDDREENLYLLETLLKGSGYQVVSAGNGAEALERLKKETIDIIISDILMPKMDGYQLCRECKKDDILGKIPFIFYTSTFTDKKDEAFALSLGAEKLVTKPVEPGAFLKMLEHVVKEHEKKTDIAPERPLEEEKSYLKQYSERLIQKLEEKTLDLEIDIVKRKRAEEKLLESEEKFRSISDTALDAIIMMDHEGNISYWNKTAEKIFGHTKEDTIGKELHKLIASERYYEAYTRGLKRFSETGEGYAVGKILELSGTRKDGTEFPLEMSLSAVKLNNKWNAAAIIRDITERKRHEEEKTTMEAQLRQAQKLESIGTLAGGVAHEINNPLMGIINYAQLIHDRIQDEKLKEFSRGIIREGNRVSKIVKNLLSFARQDKQSYSPARIEDIIDASFTLIGAILRKDQITVEQDIPDDLPKIKCRSQQIEQVLMNLLTNARDALNQRYQGFHENKIIRITVQTVEKQGAAWIRTTVEDHGIGMPKDIVDRIFDPFFTTKSRAAGPSADADGPLGTGLGLSVSYGIMQDHKGALWAESEPGEYSRFHMDLRLDNG